MNPTCPNGHEVSRGTRFCPTCGAPVAPTQARWRRPSLLVLEASVVVALVAGVLTFVLTSSGSSPGPQRLRNLAASHGETATSTAGRPKEPTPPSTARQAHARKLAPTTTTPPTTTPPSTTPPSTAPPTTTPPSTAPPTTTPPSTAPPTTTPPSTAPPTTTAPLPLFVVPGEDGTPGYSGREPSEIDFSGDAGNIATGLTWSSWGPDQAVGHGTVDIQNCIPDCASGTQTPTPVTITFSNPVGGDFTTCVETIANASIPPTTYTYPPTDPASWPIGAS